MNNPDDPTRSPVSATFRLVLAGLLAALLVAAATWLVIATIENHPFGWGDDAGAAANVQQDREKAMSRAREFVIGNFTYDKDDLETDGSLSGYVDRLSPLMTTEARSGLEQSAAGLAELIKDQGFSRTTTVEATGVQELGPDSAEVLVTGTFQGTQQGRKTGVTPFQMVVELDKVEGEWLVNDFSYVGGEQQ